jgi:hypothetical protein
MFKVCWPEAKEKPQPPSEVVVAKVVVATQLGFPPEIERTYPPVPAARALKVLVPEKYGRPPAAPVYKEEVATERDCVALLMVVRVPERPRPRVAEVVATLESAFVPLP